MTGQAVLPGSEHPKKENGEKKDKKGERETSLVFRERKISIKSLVERNNSDTTQSERQVPQ